MRLLLGLLLISAAATAPIKPEEENRFEALMKLLKYMTGEDYEQLSSFQLSGKNLETITTAIWGSSDLAGFLSSDADAEGKLEKTIKIILRLLRTLKRDNQQSLPKVTNDEDLVIIQKDIATPLIAPVVALANYAQSPDEDTLKQFIDSYKASPPLPVSEYILKNTGDFLDRCYNASHILEFDFDGLVSLLQESFIDAFIIEVFHDRLTNSKHEEQLPRLLERFKNGGKAMETTISAQKKKFDTDIIKAVTPITKKMLDKHQLKPYGDENELADKISDKLNYKFLQKFFGVIVYKSGTHAVINSDTTKFAEVVKHGYTVLVVMRTPEHEENAAKFRAIPRSRVEQVFRESYKKDDLAGTLEKVRSQLEIPSGIWMAVKSDGTIPRAEYSDLEVFDGFVFRQDGESPCPDISKNCQDAQYQPNDILVIVAH